MDFKLRKNQLGFSLIELVMVIMIISILAVTVFIRWPGTTINIEAQSTELQNDIRYAQALSMTEGQRFRWVEISSTTYQIQNGSGTAILLPSGKTTVTLGSGITFGALGNLPNNLVAFDGKGAPYVDTGSPGTALTTAATIPLTTTGASTTVTITPETGSVTTT